MSWFSRLLGQPLSLSEFAAEVRKRMLRDQPQLRVEWEPETNCLRVDGSRTVSLLRFFNQFRTTHEAEKSDFLDAVARTGTTSLEPPPTWAEAEPTLLPKVREIAYFWDRQHDEMLQQTLGEAAGVVWVSDLPEFSVYVPPVVEAGWHVEPSQVREAALRNLRARSQPAWREVSPGLQLSAWNDTYDLSRLLLPELFGTLPLRGAPIALPAARNSLLVTGEDDAQGIAAMMQLADQIIESDDFPVSRLPLKLVNGSWHDVRLPGWEERSASAWAGLYNEHSTLLQAEADDLPYAANILTASRTDGPSVRLTTWAEDVDSWLPVAPWIALHLKEEEPMAIRWEDALQHFASLLEHMPDMHPTRYRTLGFPDATQRAAAPLLPLDRVHEG